MKQMVKILVGLLLCVVLAFGLASCDGTAEIDSISISKRPTKTTYWVGETFDPTGMEITVRYADESKEAEKITSGYTVDKTEPLTLSDTKVTVTYQEKTATLNITVKENTATLTVTELPDKLDYTSDKTVDLTGISAMLVYAKGGEETLGAADLTGKLEGDVLTVTHDDASTAFTVKTEVQENLAIGSQSWYGTDNQPNLFGTWDIAKGETATLPAVDAQAGTVTFTEENWSRLPIFCLKYPKNSGTIYQAGNNIGAEVNDHLDGQEFGYTLDVKATGSFRMGFLLASSALQQLSDEWAMGIMLHFDGSALTIATAEGGGTGNVLATAVTTFENGRNNRIDFTFTRVENKVTFVVYVNDIRVYWTDENVSAHANAALEEGNFTFMAGRYEDDEASEKVETGYKNYGNRFGIYADEGTTVVLSDHK